MYNYRILLLLLFVTLLTLSCKQNYDAAPDSSGKTNYTAYYFHPAARCENCLNLESFAKELIETKFGDKPIAFKPINIDEEENKHYKNDYELMFSSLVIVKFQNGARVKWKNLDSAWSYTNNKEKFFSYAEKEINNFIEE